AAKFMVDHNKAFKSFETADARAQGHKGHADNKIGAGDVSARLEQTGFSVGDRQAVSTILQAAPQILNGCTDFDLKKELGKIAHDGKLPDGSAASPVQRQAATLILSKPELMQRIDNAEKIIDGHL